MATYVATIGLEVHAELSTKSKMFCGCKNDPHAGVPNAHTCPICLAHPGTLPVPNEEAIASVLLFGEAVGAQRATYSEFDRKNYFYPDIPKAYQISQYAFPFLTGGMLCGVALTRVHLEEDTARSQHDKGEESLVDFNRAGVPLMELVTEPVIHDAKTAGQFARELQLLLRTLGISAANMERGEMRVEANISVSSTSTLGTKVEVKNLNSFKSVESAITYEIERQTTELEAGKPIQQETRGWDEVKLRTYVQRSKETAKDYRYFPDPDIPKMDISSHEYFARLSEKMPLLPDNKRKIYNDIGIPSNQVEVIISDPFQDGFFSEAYDRVVARGLDRGLLKTAANYISSDIASVMNEGTAREAIILSSDHFVELLVLIGEQKITSRIAKDLLREVLLTNENPALLATERGLLQSLDTGALQATVDEVISEHESVVAEYKAGKQASLQFLIGQAMKKTRGTANPALLTELFQKTLG